MGKKNSCFIYETLNDVKTMVRSKNNGLMQLSGIFGVCGVKNNNNRIYEASNYAKMVKRLQEKINTEGCPGELEHPSSMNINLENISHKIDSINIDENGVVSGTITLLDTPKGKIAQAIVEGGLPLFISSRAQGNIDKNGVVTLEDLKTYDLVGTPGFSQAKMHLNENQVVESINESCYIIKEADDDIDEGCCKEKEEECVDKDCNGDECNDKERKKDKKKNEKEEESKKNNNKEMTNEELLEKVDSLNEKIEMLESRIGRHPNNTNNNDKLLEGIQNWIVNEYTPQVEHWIKEDYTKEINNGVEKRLVEGFNKIEENIDTTTNEGNTKELLEGIQNWIINEYSPKIEQWISEHYSAGVEKWIKNDYSAEVEKWITEEYSNGIQNWVVEHLAPEIDKWVCEKIEETSKVTKKDNMDSIDTVLNMLENELNESQAKPKYNRVNVASMITEGNENEPLFIREMPADKRVQWNMASDEVKESINMRAKIYNFNNANAIENFWENINFDEIKPMVKKIDEGLDEVMDSREKAIRMAFRQNRF